MAAVFSFAFLSACSTEKTECTFPQAPSPVQTREATPAPLDSVPPSAAQSLAETATGEDNEEEWKLILVNPSHALPADFSAELEDFEGGQVDARILADCEAMFAAAKADGVDLELVDAYRSRELQNRLFEEKVESYMDKGYSREDAEREAATITARADTSEHQTGLALDIVSPSHTSRNSAFDGTQAFRWLEENAGGYGFILRYPEGKTEITGVIYEPWHWRYVGDKAAAEIGESGLCLEEYMEADG